MKKSKEKIKRIEKKYKVGLVVLLIVAVLGISYGYFQAQGDKYGEASIGVETGDTDRVVYNVDKDIDINANQFNFAPGKNSLSDNAIASATLKTKNALKRTYNVYFIVENNDFVYSTTSATPEIVLSVTDPNGKLVENIDGLIHYDNGFDITTRTGSFLVMADYDIEASNGTVKQDWDFNVTMVNLDSDQSVNAGKTLNGKIYITEDKLSTYEVIKIDKLEATTTYNSINAKLTTTVGTSPVDKYYFAIQKENDEQETLKYVANENSYYSFTGLEENRKYKIYSYVVDKNGIKSNVYETEVITDAYKLPTITGLDYTTTLNSITVSVNATNGNGNVTNYYYSKDNGQTYTESTANTYTFSGLTDTTEYKIKVKVKDSNGRYSTEYYKAIPTETYIIPSVTNVASVTTYNSITLTPTGSNGTNEISKYMYSINNGEYQSSNVFSNLSESTKYTIKVKAIDSAGRESNVYSLEVTTDAYKLPNISSATTSSTSNSVTINLTASNGDGTITKYYYSKDNGSNYVESTSSSYTFTGLTSNTTYYLKAYAKDSNNRVSSTYSTTSKTLYVNPTVSSITTGSVTSSSFTVTINATAGSTATKTYYYSIDNGSTYKSSTSNSMNFTGLKSNTTYNIKGYVVDNGNVKSGEKTTSVKTSYVNPVVNSITTSNITTSSFTVTINATAGSNTIKTYYYSIDNGSTYKSSTSNSMNFTGLSTNTTYNIKVYVIDNGNVKSAEKTGSVKTSAITLATYIKSLYNASYPQGNNLFYHNGGMATVTTDGSYRYAGSTADNYVCFGSSASTCPDDNLYRIIGVFSDQVKLIKADFAGTNLLGTDGQYRRSGTPSGYYIGKLTTIYSYSRRYTNKSSNEYNGWSESTLNTTNLNVNFINNIGNEWSNKIATHIWKVGTNIQTEYSKEYSANYVDEVLKDADVTYRAKIGLAYLSDWAYAFYRTGAAGVGISSSSNWMYIGDDEWTLTLNGSGTRTAYAITDQGEVSSTWPSNGFAIRPCFYLNSNVNYLSGSGTQSSPYRIS